MKTILTLITVLLLAPLTALNAGDTLLVKDGRSAYVIYHAKDAPASVKEGARELQRVLEIATQAQLPIVQEPSEFMIVLGDAPETSRAGIDIVRLADEGFEIKTQGKQVFIAGRDTKDGVVNAAGGVTDGTYYGVMEFLERYVGVHWLMPGEWGEDVPSRSTLTLPEIAMLDQPDFPSRSMTMRFGVISNKWLRHLRNTVSRQPINRSGFNHAWHSYDMPERLKGYPDYMALVNGKRTRIVEDWRKEMQEMKFCTTNPGLLDLYADAILEAMVKEPAQEMWPIAPSDGGGWCECEKCTALDQPCDWIGNRMYGKKSKTPRVLTFYNEIAKRVKTKQPTKLLGGYVYAAYTYPPAKPMTVESNLYLTLAVRAYYGFTLYREDFMREVPQVIAAWDTLMKGRMGWVDYSTYVGMDTPMGTPYPPGKSILKMLFPAIKKHDWQSVYWGSTVGTTHGWGSLHNYLVAKLMWHADADVDALSKDWLARAYGPGGPLIGQIYELLDEKLATYKRANPKDFEYDAVPAQVKAIHLPLFPRMEAIYLDAMSKTQTEAQRKRLQMFGDNLVLLHWHLRKAGWLDRPEQSTFYRSDADFTIFIQKNSTSPSIATTNSPPEVFLKPQLTPGETKPASVDK
jgi:hypothetical protein|uniref:DUF4838 domain-containing protein n=1 Tax=Prosthecobacter sp. TaxID=1965333 RepID=UPI0037831C5A